MDKQKFEIGNVVTIGFGQWKVFASAKDVNHAWQPNRIKYLVVNTSNGNVKSYTPFDGFSDDFEGFSQDDLKAAHQASPETPNKPTSSDVPQASKPVSSSQPPSFAPPLPSTTQPESGSPVPTGQPSSSMPTFDKPSQQPASETAPQSKRVPLSPLPQVKQPSSQMPPLPQAKPTSQPPPSTTAQPSPSYVSFMQQPITTGASAPDVSSQNGQGMSDFKDAVREFRDAIREVKQLIQTMAGQGSQQGSGGFKMPPGGLPIPKQTVPRTSGDRNDRVPSVMSGQALGFLAQVFRALS